MFINEAVTRYMEETATKRRRAKELEELTRPQWGKPCKTPLKDLEAATAELALLNIELKIRHDNTRRMIYNATILTVLEILKKWNGKPYGEKTKQKINDEMKTRFNCALYLSNTYGGKITLVPLNGEGYTNHSFKYDDFNIYTKYQDGQRPPVLNDNRINGAITAADVFLSDCPEIVPDPHAHAVRIISEFQRIRQHYSEFETELSQFNNLLPSQMDRRSVRDFKNYL